MKSLILAAALILGATSQAQAGEGWLCGLTYKAEVRAAQLIVGKYKVDGTGTLRCNNAEGEKLQIPVKLTARGAPVSARVAFAHFTMYGASANVTLGALEPRDLLGKYHFTQAQGAFIGGAGVIVGSHVTNNLNLALSVNAIEGVGVNLGVTTMRIEEDESRKQQD